MKSKMKPIKKITTMTTKTIPITPPGIWEKILVINSSPPNPLKTRTKIDDPISIINTIEVISVVPCTASVKFFLFNFPLESASKIAPNAPTPAASVGVAIPASIEPRTATIKRRGGAKLVSTSFKVLWSDFSTSWAGAAIGFKYDLIIT